MKKLRQQRWPYHAIAHKLRVSKSTVAQTLKAAGLRRRSLLEPKPLPRPPEACELLGVQVQKPTRGLDLIAPGHRVTQNRKDRNRSPGWSYVFAAVDAHSRLAYVEVKANERKESAVAFLLSALRYYRRTSVRVQAVMTDHAKVFQSKRFQRALRQLGIRHKTTPPYTPRVNGKVERFIRTLLNEWA